MELEKGPERFTDEGMSFQRRAMRIHRASGGSHNAEEVEIPLIREADLSKMEEEQILEGLSDIDPNGSSGFAGFFRKKVEAGQALPVDTSTFNKEQGREEEQDLDDRDQGESSSSGHEPTSPQRATYAKRRVYIPRMDKLAMVYEDSNGVLTVKTADNMWLEIEKSEVELVKTGGSTLPVSTRDKSAYPEVERKNSPGSISPAPTVVNEQSEETMSSYSERRKNRGL